MSQGSRSPTPARRRSPSPPRRRRSLTPPPRSPTPPRRRSQSPPRRRRSPTPPRFQTAGQHSRGDRQPMLRQSARPTTSRSSSRGLERRPLQQLATRNRSPWQQMPRGERLSRFEQRRVSSRSRSQLPHPRSCSQRARSRSQRARSRSQRARPRSEQRGETGAPEKPPPSEVDDLWKPKVVDGPQLRNGDRQYQAEIVCPSGGTSLNSQGRARTMCIRGPFRPSEDQAWEDAKLFGDAKDEGMQALRKVADRLRKIKRGHIRPDS